MTLLRQGDIYQCRVKCQNIWVDGKCIWSLSDSAWVVQVQISDLPKSITDKWDEKSHEATWYPRQVVRVMVAPEKVSEELIFVTEKQVNNG